MKKIIHRFATATALLLTALVITFGCKSTTEPDPVVLTSLQGNWKITGLTVNPGYTVNGVTITNLSSALPLLGENCLKDAVVTFNANGTISNNVATQSTCTNATYTQQLINTFFGPNTTFSETGTQATLNRPGQPPLIGSKVLTATTATITTQLATNPDGQPISTTYTVVLTKQ
ncbi:hypothetical protein [Fibrella aquatica]|uniref:hypothetical protein n=1 Tax=Fibrella aquatica TaxID=3242487 RepID=UPI00352024E8